MHSYLDVRQNGEEKRNGKSLQANISLFFLQNTMLIQTNSFVLCSPLEKLEKPGAATSQSNAAAK
jgi:hypothetical protein